MLDSKINRDNTVSLIGEQGTNWEHIIEVFSDEAKTVPKPLTGYLARGAFKKSYRKDSPVQLTFTCEILPYNASSNPFTNKIKISATPAQTSATTDLYGPYVIEAYSGSGIVIRAMYGSLQIKPEV